VSPTAPWPTLLERDRIFTDQLADDCARTGMAAVHVDGSSTIEDTAGRLAAHLGLSR